MKRSFRVSSLAMMSSPWVPGALGLGGRGGALQIRFLPAAGRRSGRPGLVGGLDPGLLLVGLQHRVGDDLRIEAVEEAGDGLPTLDDGRDELPGQVVAEDGRRLPLSGVTRA